MGGREGLAGTWGVPFGTVPGRFTPTPIQQESISLWPVNARAGGRKALGPELSPDTKQTRALETRSWGYAFIFAGNPDAMLLTDFFFFPRVELVLARRSDSRLIAPPSVTAPVENILAAAIIVRTSQRAQPSELYLDGLPHLSPTALLIALVSGELGRSFKLSWRS